tara:strand:- start:338 stop:880 length:543 start_codon:yes stop_codon:yes gene_type:complete
MDLEKFSTVSVDTSLTNDIALKCNKLLDIRQKIERCLLHLDDLKKDEKELSQDHIPSAMQQAGISMLKLNDGSTVQVKPHYSARITQSRKNEAFEWLRQNGAGDLIKNIVSVNFGRTEDETAKKVFEKFQEDGYNVVQNEKVEPMTLKAFVREQVEKGQNVPTDLFSVYIANETTIKTKE